MVAFAGSVCENQLLFFGIFKISLTECVNLVYNNSIQHFLNENDAGTFYEGNVPEQELSSEEIEELKARFMVTPWG